MDRRLSQVRQENPEADLRLIVGDFDQLLSALVDAKTLEAFAKKFGMTLPGGSRTHRSRTFPPQGPHRRSSASNPTANFLGQQRSRMRKSE